MPTPVCALGIRTDGRAVTRVAYLAANTPARSASDAIAERAVREIERYLADPGSRYEVPLAPTGPPFQRRVWDAIRAIPAGESRTYGELSRKLVTAARAVGQACGANPIALLIPCHRVVGGAGALGGFMGSGLGFARPARVGKSGSDSNFLPGMFEPAADPADSIDSADSADIADPTGSAAFSPAAIKLWLLAHERARYGL